MQWPVLPDYGYISRWPEDGQAFIHPEDIAGATRCFPSHRILRRESFDGTHYHYRYGTTTFRLCPVMWIKVAYEGIDIGDRIETIGLGFEQDRFVAEVCGMHFIRRKGRIAYRLRRGEQQVPHLFTAEKMKVLTEKHRLNSAD